MIVLVVSTQRPAVGFASPDVPAVIAEASAAPWDALRASIMAISIGVPADLKRVLDAIDPSGPGAGFPMSHRQVFEKVGFTAQSVALQAAHLAVAGVRDAPTQTALIAGYTALDTNEAVGYAVHLFDMRERVCQREYVMFKVGDPRTKGIGMHATATWDRLMPELGIDTLTMTAAYVGRLVWALDGFDFTNEQTRDMVRQRFVRFMEHFGLAADDLEMRRDTGRVEPFAIEKLVHAWDFAHVISKRGNIRLPARTSDGQNDEQLLAVGRAFMLGDFRSPGLADSVCPDYAAARPVGLDTPNQLQAARYNAARISKQRT